MINFFKILLINIFCLFLVNCSQVLETVELGALIENSVNDLEEQDQFDINLRTLTIAEANKAKSEIYKRNVMVSGSLNKANVYDEDTFFNGNFPPEKNSEDYVIGIGDELTFSLFLDNAYQGQEMVGNLPLNDAAITTDDLIVTQSRVGSDGSMLLLGLGRLEAENRTLNELRDESRNVLIRKGFAPNFQLEITDFRSRKAFIFGEGIPDGVIAITQTPMSLKELAARSGYAFAPNFVNSITLQRGDNLYQFTAEDLLNDISREIFIEDKDQIVFEKFEYQKGKVYAISGTDNAEIMDIDPASRQTMADVLFSPGGPLSNIFAERSEIYLLRGANPVNAYHLDAQNASRILVAAAMELRPSDIIYVAERPIISFSRLLAELTPLRNLLRDVRNNNIP